jgi:hypothetical protein
VPAFVAALAIAALPSASIRNLINPPCMLVLLFFGVHGAEPLKPTAGHVPHGLLYLSSPQRRSHVQP